MIKMPKQLIILALVLSLYFWPWQLISGDAPEDWLASVVTMQLAFVIACNILVRENWIAGIIIVEAICMFANVALVAGYDPVLRNHSDIMQFAFILELLIISISLQGAAVGFKCRLPMAGFCMGSIRNNARYFHNRNQVSQ